MAEHSTEAVRTNPGGDLAVVFRAGAMRIPVEVDPLELCPVLTFRARPWGEPIRCQDCGQACHPAISPKAGALGRYRCEAHQERELTRFYERDIRPVKRAASGRKSAGIASPAIPLKDAIPVLAPVVRETGTPKGGVRDRWLARVAAERSQA